MNYSSTQTASGLKTRLAESSRYFSSYRDRTLTFLATVRFLPQIFGNYFFWFGILLMTQTAEVFILAYSHHLYASGVPLKALRMLSIVTVFGFLILFPLRSEPALAQRSRNESDLKGFLKVIAQTLFLISASIAMLLAIYFVFFTSLLVVTAPLMRAVILTGVVSLPFDGLLIFLFYNLSKFGVPWLPFRPRLLTLLALGMSLTALAYGEVQLYFILKIAPKVALTILLWHACGGQTSELLTIPSSVIQRNLPKIMALGKSFYPLATTFLLFDLSMLYVGKGFVRSDSALGLMVFMAHKLSHLAFVMSFRILLTSHYITRCILRFGSLREIFDLLAKSFGLGIVCFLVSLIFTPLLIYQRTIWGFSWIEEDSVLPLILVVASALLRVMVANTLVLTWLKHRTATKPILGALGLFLSNYLLGLHSWRLNHWITSTSLVSVLFLADVIFLFAFLMLLFLQLAAGPKLSSTQEPGRIPFLDLLQSISENDPTWRLLLLRCWKGESLALEHRLRSFGKRLEWLRWDRERYLVRCSTQRSIHQVCIEEFAAAIASIPREMIEFKVHSIHELLAALCGRVPPPSSSCRLPSIPIARRDACGWHFAQGCSAEERNTIYKFLNELESRSDPLTPSAYYSENAKGLVLLTANGHPYELFVVPISQRSNLTALRWKSMIQNISEALQSPTKERT